MLVFGHDLRYALRGMRRNPGVTAVAVLALGLGIGANSAVFTVLNGVLVRPLPFADSGRLVLLSNVAARTEARGVAGLWQGDYLELGRHEPLFAGVATFNQNQTTLTGVGDAARIPSADVTASFFPLLGVAPEIGRTFREHEDHVVLLSDRLWRSRFRGDTGVVGRAVRLDGEISTVVGVMPADLDFPYQAQLWTPLEVRVDPHMGFYRPVVARLKPGQTKEQAQAAFAAFSRATAGTSASDLRDPPVPRVLALKDFLTGDVRESLRIIAAAVGFVLLIACANVANLLLMRAASRREEMGIRMAMGAGRGRLARQLLTESMLLGVSGGAVGILFALWGVPALLEFAPKGWIPRASEVHIDGTVLAFTLVVSILTGLLFGMVPAWQAARRSVRESLSHGNRVAGGGGLRNVLAVAEIAMSLVLLAGAGLMLKSLWRIHAVNTGFHADHVMTMTVDLPGAVYREAPEMKALHGHLLERLAAIPGVSAAAAVNSLPEGGFRMRGNFNLRDRRFPDGYAVYKVVVSPGYFHAMGIPLVSGRDFERSDASDSPGVAIVSRSVARIVWPGEDPIGRQITEKDRPEERQEKDWYTVVGVVDDVRQESPMAKPDSGVYFSYQQTPHNGWLPHMSYVVRTAAGANLAASAMKAALESVDPDLPAGRIMSMENVIAALGAARTFQARLLLAFALLALTLAVVGVYGVLAYAVNMRTREIGIRMALGAGRADVLAMVIRRTAVLGGAGLAIGSVGALFGTRALEKLLYDVKPNDPGTFVAVAAVLAAATLAAGWIPARRAARVDPLVALRWE
jgi:predicted permease